MYDIIICGCGVSGAAIAYELSRYKLKIAIIEKENDIATGATKANSGIIHAGFDPEEGSLMAKLNVRGALLASKVCEKLDVPYKKCGAMVLAFSDKEKEALEVLYARGEANGVKNQAIIDGDGARALEPNLSENVKWALLEPDSAIILPWEFCFALAETAVKNQAELFLNQEVVGIEEGKDSYRVITKNGNKEKELEARIVINATGVDSAAVHDMALGHKFDSLPKRGQYYLLDKAEGNRVSRTIFQAPSENGKGVLVSPTVHGNLIVGPNSERVSGNDTATTLDGLNFVKDMAVKSVPSIDFGQNIRNFSGVRARTDVKDFIIERDGGFIDVAGICSPGLSSALAIGEYVAQMVKETKRLDISLKENFVDERKKIRFKDLSDEEKAELIKKNPAYGHVICRCETITEGEILETFNSPIPPVSVDGIKRRAGTGMGRCQGGFCGPQIIEIISRQLGIALTEIPKEHAGTNILTDKMGF